eukprot:SAG31_NODE_37_length_31616_cov_38.688359_21_plen_91_part_00
MGACCAQTSVVRTASPHLDSESVSVLSSQQEIKLQSASDTTSDAGRLTPTTSKGSRGSDFESIRSDGESMLMPTQTEIVSDVNHKNATYR